MTGANRSEPAVADGAGGFHSPPKTTASGNCLDFSPPIGRTSARIGLAILDFTGNNQRHSNGHSYSVSYDEHTTITSPPPFTSCDVPAIRQSSAFRQRESLVVIQSLGASTDREGKRGVGW
ncbi:unnamed protein product [Lactuca saligna]|uniref:Uncharacterized protein n=1 Tax=Lactuca saligna TaxID=75948 RepID=A0AA36A5K9_LACSI|nr:unnamed protein product [Lactuca saligna]